MPYVGIDQHKRHLTICVRNEQGDIVFRQQVSTGGKKIDGFLEKRQDDAGQVGGYVAVLEVCGSFVSCWDTWSCTCCATIPRCGRGIQRSNGVAGRTSPASPSCADGVKPSGTC